MTTKRHTFLTCLLSIALAMMPFAGASALSSPADDVTMMQHCHEMAHSSDQTATASTPSQDCCGANACQCMNLISCQASGHSLSFIMTPFTHTTLSSFSDEISLDDIAYYQNRITTPDIQPPIA